MSLYFFLYRFVALENQFSLYIELIDGASVEFLRILLISFLDGAVFRDQILLDSSPSIFVYGQPALGT